jgi:ABC-2 type transport system permease protein
VTAFIEHLRFDFLAGLRNSTTVLMFYLFPLGFYALMSIVMVEINPAFADNAITALVVVTLVAGTLLGLPGQFVETRQLGVYRMFKVNGVPAGAILASPLLSGIGHALIAASIVAVTGGPIFGLPSPSHWGSFYLVMVLSAVCLGSLAALIGVVSDTSRSTVLWSQLVFLPSMLIGGLMVDLELLPESVLPFAKLLPPTYAGQALLGAGFDLPTLISPTGAIAVLVASSILDAVLATMLFRWDPANRTGRMSKAWALTALVPFVVGAIFL